MGVILAKVRHGRKTLLVRLVSIHDGVLFCYLSRYMKFQILILDLVLCCVCVELTADRGSYIYKLTQLELKLILTQLNSTRTNSDQLKLTQLKLKVKQLLNY